MKRVFSEEALTRLESAHPEGLSVQTAVEILKAHGVELAEATFRKYVQLGLLPRSRRVGRKGKHQGSHGLYPASCVGRVAEIRQLMDAGYTLEQIQQSPVAFAFEIDDWRRTADDILARLDGLAARGEAKPGLSRRLKALRTQVAGLADALGSSMREACAWPAPDAVHRPPEGRRAVAARDDRRAAKTAVTSKKATGACSGRGR